MGQELTAKPVRFSHHAQTVMAERGIRPDWVETVLAAPDWTEPDASDSRLRRAFGRVSEFGARVLRVVYDERRTERWIVTVFFDRAQRDRPRKEPP